jgi:sugar phosphate permease
MPKINTKLYLLISMALSGLVTILIAFSSGLRAFWWILSINGILQAGLWGMCIGTLRKYLPDYLVPRALTCMSIGTAIAGVISYGSASIAVAINFWNLPFIVLGAILFISAFIYFLAVKLCDKNKEDPKTIKQNVLTKNNYDKILPLNNKLARVLFLVISFIISIGVHFIFYGTQNWIPSLLAEVYGKSSSFGILISVLAPLATTLGPIVAVKHTEKAKNYLFVLMAYAILFGVLSLLLALLFDKGLILSLAILLLYLLTIHASVTIITSILSFKIGSFINSGAYSSLMNAGGGFSAGFAPMLLALVIDGFGWKTYYTVVCIITLSITLLIIFSTLFVYFYTKKRKAN